MKKTLPRRTLVIGGAASGKSAWAEAFVSASRFQPAYIATAQAFDDEMAEKIAHHKKRRGPEWLSIEEPLDLRGALAQCPENAMALIDCATLWLTNHMIKDADIAAQTEAFVKLVTRAPVPLVVVSNEVGDGIVPGDAMSRRFRNAQGYLNQRLAAEADLVVRVTVGLPLALKGEIPA